MSWSPRSIDVVIKPISLVYTGIGHLPEVEAFIGGEWLAAIKVIAPPIHGRQVTKVQKCKIQAIETGHSIIIFGSSYRLDVKIEQS